MNKQQNTDDLTDFKQDRMELVLSTNNDIQVVSLVIEVLAINDHILYSVYHLSLFYIITSFILGRFDFICQTRVDFGFWWRSNNK